MKKKKLIQIKQQQKKKQMATKKHNISFSMLRVNILFFCSYVVCGWSEAEEDVSLSILWKNFYEAVKYNKTRENTYWRETL